MHNSPLPLFMICACIALAVASLSIADKKAREKVQNFAPTNIVIMHDRAENGSPSPGGEGRGEGGITPSPTLNSNNSQPSTK